ncbi:hypothetical protein RCO27_18130 [Sphingosinicella sp. LHD-64]|uniref:hypothetical protein n=1 Tax=Sphingosinicella sp. LHD-64 TaxID=3072139 RepID=UPI00280CCF1C|nr:hypothetical protein [Sphingosinicella sp. LHD-64]MDQ8758149.1 hypothetical protein [Sphingosinicella sp. LHD-64]
MSKTRMGLWRAYRVPTLLGVISLVGLISALLEDGPFDVVSWLLLGVIVVAMWPALKR